MLYWFYLACFSGRCSLFGGFVNPNWGQNVNISQCSPWSRWPLPIPTEEAQRQQLGSNKSYQIKPRLHNNNDNNTRRGREFRGESTSEREVRSGRCFSSACCCCCISCLCCCCWCCCCRACRGLSFYRFVGFWLRLGAVGLRVGVEIEIGSGIGIGIGIGIGPVG